MEDWQKAVIITLDRYRNNTIKLFGQEMMQMVDSTLSSQHHENATTLANQIISHYIKTCINSNIDLKKWLVHTVATFILYDKAPDEFIMEWQLKGFDFKNIVVLFNFNSYMHPTWRDIYQQCGWNFDSILNQYGRYHDVRGSQF